MLQHLSECAANHADMIAYHELYYQCLYSLPFRHKGKFTLTDMRLGWYEPTDLYPVVGFVKYKKIKEYFISKTCTINNE